MLNGLRAERRRRRRRRRRRNYSFTTFQHYIGYSSHYIHTFIVHKGERKERQKLDTEKSGIPPKPPWFFNVPGVKLRHTGQTFYVPIRRTKLGNRVVAYGHTSPSVVAAGTRTRYPEFLSRRLYHWAIAAPKGNWIYYTSTYLTEKTFD